MKTILQYSWQQPRRFLSAIVLWALSFPVFSAATVIDVLVVYTDGVAALYGGDPSTRINQIFQVTNQIYADSGVDLEVRVAGTLRVNYTDDNAAETALNAITFNQHSAFSGVAAAREQAKADMVILYRPYRDVHGSCGVAWLGGANGSIGLGYKDYMFSHVAINACGDDVTAHELGHNMGLKHSRKQDGVGGVVHYALGHGVVNSFTTIMAYQTDFNVDYWTGKVYKFSNPDIICKNNLPCGVDRNNTTSGADARHALHITAPQIANYYVGAAASSSVASSLVSRSSSSSSRAAATSSKSSTSSAAGNASAAAELKEKVSAARAAHSSAVAALAANKLAISAATTAERNAKTALTTATRNLTTATKNYDKAVKAYDSLVAKLNPLSAQLNTALAAYYSATTASAKNSRLTAYNNLVTRYNTLVEQITGAVSAANVAQQQIAPATASVTAATASHNKAVAVTAAEKAKTTALSTAVNAALTALKALEVQYKAALKACKCTV